MRTCVHMFSMELARAERKGLGVWQVKPTATWTRSICSNHALTVCSKGWMESAEMFLRCVTWKSFWASGTLFLSCLAELLKARLARSGALWKPNQNTVGTYLGESECCWCDCGFHSSVNPCSRGFQHQLCFYFSRKKTTPHVQHDENRCDQIRNILLSSS